MNFSARGVGLIKALGIALNQTFISSSDTFWILLIGLCVYVVDQRPCTALK